MNGVKSGDSPDFTELLLVDIRLDRSFWNSKIGLLKLSYVASALF